MDKFVNLREKAGGQIRAFDGHPQHQDLLCQLAGILCGDGRNQREGISFERRVDSRPAEHELDRRGDHQWILEAV